MVNENFYKYRYFLIRFVAYANILIAPLLSGFSIYIVLSYLLVPSRITIPISIIMSILIFGLTKYYGIENKNNFVADRKEEYHKLSVAKIIFVIAYVVCLIFSFSSAPSNNIFVPWELLTTTQIVKLAAAISLSIFLPGYAIMDALGLKHELKTLPKFLLAYLISVFVTGFTGYSLASIGLPISDSLIIFNGIYASILVLFLLRNVIEKEFVKSFSSNSNFQEILRHNRSEILVFASLCAFVFLSTYYLYNGTIIGDQWSHHGNSFPFLSGTFKDFAISGTNDIQAIPFNPAFLASFFALSNTPPANAYVAIDFLNVMPIFAFYYFFSKWFPNYKKATLLATTLFMLSSGFGWIYTLSLADINPITSPSAAMEIFREAGSKTYDVWLPNTFLNVGHPDITSPLILFGLPAGFVLLGLLKEDMRNKFKYLLIVAAVSILGLLSHSEFGLFIIVGSTVPLIFMLKGKNSIFAALLSVLLIVFLISIFFPGKFYTLPKIFGISLTLLELFFVSFTGILYASKVMLRLYKPRNVSNIFKKVFTRKILFILGIILVSIFSYLYVSSFIIWSHQIPNYNVQTNTADFKVVPWHFYPLKLGITGLVGFACLLSYFFKRFEKEVFIFGIIAIAAFLMGPYYNEFRFNKYIMISFVGFASILLFKILTIQKFFITKPLINGIIIGSIITFSSFSILMYVGYTALALENPNFNGFNLDLPRRHFPNDFGLLNFLHQNLNLKFETVSIPLNESLANQGLNSELEGLVGIPQNKVYLSSALESSSVEGFYTLLDQSNSRYVVFPKSFIDRGLSQTNQFALENFPMAYKDNNYAVLSVPSLSPPTDESNVTLILNTKDDVKVLSKEILNYSDNTVFDTSKLTKTKSSVTLYGNSTLWSQSGIINNSANLIETRIKFIDEHTHANHAGIVWDDGKQMYYVFLRSDKLVIYTPEIGEFGSAPIKRGHQLWHSLKVLVDNDVINVYFDDELKIRTSTMSTEQFHFSKVGLRVFNSVAAFEPILIGSGELINFDPKFNYEYPLNVLALSKIKYNVLVDDDIGIFSKKTVFLARDPLDVNKYTEFVKNGGTVIVFNSDNKLNGGFSDFLGIHAGEEKKFDNILSNNGVIKISGLIQNLQVNSADAVVKSFYMKDNQRVSPFIIEKKYENGKIIFVNTSGYFKSVSESPQKFFLSLGKILNQTGLDLQQSQKELTTSAIPLNRFVGDFIASGSVQIESSSMLISRDSGFTISTESDNQTTYVGSQKSQTTAQITGLQIFGQTTIRLNSANLSGGLNSEYGYIPFVFPNGFNMIIELSNESRVKIFTVDNNEPIMIPSNKMQGNRIEIQSPSIIDPTMAPDLIFMKNPIIKVNGTTSFHKLHANDPIDPTKPWAGGIPVVINGIFTAEFSHLDVKPYDFEKSITYFKWIKVNSTTNIGLKNPYTNSRITLYTGN